MKCKVRLVWHLELRIGACVVCAQATQPPTLGGRGVRNSLFSARFDVENML